MKSRKIIAKRNLKKSIYLGGGMAAFTAAVGLAVSIPVYNKIQEELSKTTSKLKDLSGMMSQLTNKLGIPEGASFQKELAGGYEVVFENGQTKIYKDNGEGKSLIINMNGDGTVGSAAQLQGPAAQTMLGVIQNAKASMEDDQSAMSDIIGPFADQAEDTSLATESAITGESVAALAKRNQLSAGENKAAQAAAQKRLDDLVARNKAIDAAALKAAETRAKELKAAAEKAKEDADKLAAAKRAGDAAKLQQVQDDQANAAVQPLKDFIATLDYTNPPAGPVAVTSDAPGPLSDPEIIDLANKNIGWATEAKLTAPVATDVDGSKVFLDGLRTFLQAKVDKANDNDGKNDLREYFQTQKIAAVQKRLDKIKEDAAKALAAAKLAATQRTTDHQMTKAADAGHVTPAIVKLAKSLPNAINALMSAKYGYMKEGVYKNPSDSVYKLIKGAMLDQGVSSSTFDAIQNKIIQPLYDDTATVDPTSGKKVQGTISFSEVVNTFALKETSVSRLLVLKASYSTGTTDNEVVHDQLFLANQTTKSPIDFESEGDVLQTIKSLNTDGTPNTLYTAANYLVEAVNRDINPSITRDAAVALKDVVKKGVAGALKGIKNPAVFSQLVLVAKAIDPIDRPIQEKALVEILLSLAKKYLFEGKDVKVDGQAIIDTVNEAFKYDGTKEPTLTLDATEQETPIVYGPLMKMIINKINDPAFTEYTNFTDGAKPTLAFVDPKMVTIDEVEAMMGDSGLKNQIQSFKDIEQTDEGKRLVAADWKLVFDIMRSNQADHAIKILKNQDLSTITMNMEYLKSVLAKSLLPNDASTSAVYASLERLTTIWGYKGKTGLSDEEKAFRDKIIDEELTSSDIQEQLPAGDITFDAISKAFEILGKFGYIKSDANADTAKVAIFNSFMNKETDTKEFALSTIVSLEKYYTGTGTVADEYINDVINKVLTDEDFAKDADTAKNIDRLFTNWGAGTKSSLTDEELAFRNFVIEDEIKNDKVQEALTAGEISSADIKTAFKVLTTNGYIASDTSADADNVKTYTAFATGSTTTKEQVLSLIASLDKYSTGHDELNKGGYINDVINKVLTTEDFAKTYDFAIKQLDFVEENIIAAKADSLKGLTYAMPYKEFIFEDKDTNDETIKSVKLMFNYIDTLEDGGTDEPEIVKFKTDAIKHLFDKSTPADIDKIFAYIKYMIEQDNKGRSAGDAYKNDEAKKATMHQVEMYGDKFFGVNTPIDDKAGDEAKASMVKFQSMVGSAKTDAAKARLKLISKFPTITDAWQSGIEKATPATDPAFASQAEQAIPSVIYSIGYDQSRNVFYIIGNLSKVASIGGRPTGSKERHAEDSDKKILYDENKGNSLFLFEASLAKSNGKYVLNYHRITDMDFKVEDQYNVGQGTRLGAVTYVDDADHSKGIKMDDSTQPLKKLGTATASTYNPTEHSFVVYGSGGSYGHGHTVFKYTGGRWTATSVDWKNGVGIVSGTPIVAAGAPGKGAAVGGHSIGEYHYIGTSTIIGSDVYAPDNKAAVWYKIKPDGTTDGIIFSGVPAEYVKPVQPKDTTQPAVQTWNTFPAINMIASITGVKDESVGSLENHQWAVFVDWNTHKLLKVDVATHRMSQFSFYETDKDGNLVQSKQEFLKCQAITTTNTGSIYISAGETNNQQVYRVYLSDGKWQIEKVGNAITDLTDPITSLYHYEDSKGNSYILAISLHGVKVIKDIFAQ